jgi:hypothetical protein
VRRDNVNLKFNKLKRAGGGGAVTKLEMKISLGKKLRIYARSSSSILRRGKERGADRGGQRFLHLAAGRIAGSWLQATRSTVPRVASGHDPAQHGQRV